MKFVQIKEIETALKHQIRVHKRLRHKGPEITKYRELNWYKQTRNKVWKKLAVANYFNNIELGQDKMLMSTMTAIF